MNRWFNKDKTLMIDLEKVSYFYYHNDMFLVAILLLIDGMEVTLRDEDAMNIYKLLTTTENNKQLLKG